VAAIGSVGVAARQDRRDAEKPDQYAAEYPDIAVPEGIVAKEHKPIRLRVSRACNKNPSHIVIPVKHK
jgi:hypothetical protein